MRPSRPRPRSQPARRIILLRICLLLLCGSPAAGAAAGDAAPPRRPNILIAFADDWGRFASRYAKIDGPGTPNDLIHTPNFDRLADQGVVFRQAFVSAPSCTPCRSALLSGQHFWRTGRSAILNGAVWQFDHPAFPLMLRDQAGYRLGKSYKVWSPGSPADAPIGGKAHAFEKRGRRFNQFSQNVTRMTREGVPLDQAKQRLYDEVLGNFDDFLGAGQDGQPFCFWFGPTTVHRSWERGSGKALWGLDPDRLQGNLPPFLPDVPEVREDFADYLGEAMAFDTMLGLLVDRLKATGQWDDTVLIVSGDHGPPGFPHGKCNLYDFGVRVSLMICWGKNVSFGTRGRVIDDLVSLTDIAPTLLELARLTPDPKMTGRSLTGILRSDRSGSVEGREAVFFGRERHVANAREGFLPYPQRAIRTPDHLLIINFHPERWPLGEPYRLDGDPPPSTAEVTERTRVTLPDEDAGPTKAWLVGVRNDPSWQPLYQLAYDRRPREELYDLKSDPHQVRNVAQDPAYADVRDRLRQRLLDELRSTDDPRMINDGEFFETPPMAGAPTNTSGEETVSPDRLRSGK
jgi:arylsulfatase A-like enzyme